MQRERTYNDLDDITKQAIDDAFSGRGVKYYDSMDDLLQDVLKHKNAEKFESAKILSDHFIWSKKCQHICEE